MAGLPSRHRSLFLLALVVLAQVLMLAVQIKRDPQGRLVKIIDPDPTQLIYTYDANGNLTSARDVASKSVTRSS